MLSILLIDLERFKAHHHLDLIPKVSRIGRGTEIEMDTAESNIEDMDPGGSTDI